MKKPDLYDMKGGDLAAVWAALARAMTPELGEAILKEPKIANALAEKGMEILEQRKQENLRRLHGGMFSSAEDQVRTLCARSSNAGWPSPLAPRDIERALKYVPEWPLSTDPNQLLALVLVPRFPERPRNPELCQNHLDPVTHTLMELRDATPGMSSGTINLRKIQRISYSSYREGLAWELYDLAANRGKALHECASGEEYGDVGLMVAALVHRGWIYAMDGESVPFVRMAGCFIPIWTERGISLKSIDLVARKEERDDDIKRMNPVLRASDPIADPRYAIPKRLLSVPCE